MPRTVSPDHVRVRAYFAWLNGGATHGHDVADWLAAEAAQRRSDAARQGAATRAAARTSLAVSSAARDQARWVEDHDRAALRAAGY